MSAFAHLNGQHDFNRHPLAPLGIEVHSYVPPDEQKTWGVKCKKGYYIGTSREHYRYFQAYIPETGGIQGSETMFFKHKYITMPALTSANNPSSQGIGGRIERQNASATVPAK